VKSTVRARFRVAAGLASVSGCLAVLTLVWRDWIEVLTGFQPDCYQGWLEGMIVTGLFLTYILFSLAARAEWCRLRPATAGSLIR